jgi:hypothetical protein
MDRAGSTRPTTIRVTSHLSFDCFSHSPLLLPPGQNFFQGTLPTQVGDIRSLYNFNLGTLSFFGLVQSPFFVVQFELCSLLAVSYAGLVFSHK